MDKTHEALPGKVLPTAVLPDKTPADREFKAPLNSEFRSITGPNPRTTPPSHGNQSGTGNRGEGTSVHMAPTQRGSYHRYGGK
jgi:hypothetical protein